VYNFPKQIVAIVRISFGKVITYFLVHLICVIIKTIYNVIYISLVFPAVLQTKAQDAY